MSWVEGENRVAEVFVVCSVVANLKVKTKEKKMLSFLFQSEKEFCARTLSSNLCCITRH